MRTLIFKKLRNPMFATLAASLVMLNACGRVGSNQAQMSESQALGMIAGTPVGNARDAFGRHRASSAGLVQLLKTLIASGQLKVPTALRGASNGAPNLGVLNNVFSLLQSGQANSIFGLASGLLNMNGGSGAGLSGILNGILQLLTTALPLVSAIAPQFAPIISALLVIIPLVEGFFSIFAPPASSSSSTSGSSTGSSGTTTGQAVYFRFPAFC